MRKKIFEMFYNILEILSIFCVESLKNTKNDKEADAFSLAILLIVFNYAVIGIKFIGEGLINIVIITLTYINQNLIVARLYVNATVSFDEMIFTQKIYDMELLATLQSYLIDIRTMVKMAVVLIFEGMLFLIFRKYLKDSVRVATIIAILMTIINFFIFDKNSIYGMLFYITIILTLLYFKPIGSLTYMYFIIYFFGSIKLYKAERQAYIHHKKGIGKSILLLASYFLGIFSLHKIFPQLTLTMSILIVLSIYTIIWMNSVENKILALFRKMAVYVIFVPIVISYNNNLNISDLFKVFVTFTTVFFAFERVANIVKELKKIIISNKKLYLIDYLKADLIHDK